MKAIVELAREALELPAHERLKLARILLDVTEPDQNFAPDVDAVWEDEIRARIRAVQDGTARSRSVSELFVELDRRYPA
jgi:hypothetical protein